MKNRKTGKTIKTLLLLMLAAVTAITLISCKSNKDGNADTPKETNGTGNRPRLKQRNKTTTPSPFPKEVTIQRYSKPLGDFTETISAPISEIVIS